MEPIIPTRLHASDDGIQHHFYLELQTIQMLEIAVPVIRDFHISIAHHIGTHGGTFFGWHILTSIYGLKYPPTGSRLGGTSVHLAAHCRENILVSLLLRVVKNNLQIVEELELDVSLAPGT